ncbi:MAG: DUF4157 domain-containing protein [Cyclobacteriaceae bacterium]|jgi:hypothetical protein|nr:DUF4157 domain-containing protein [Flammeovirgaceae bacterium]
MKTHISKSVKITQPKVGRKGTSLAPPPFQRKANKTGMPDQLKSGVESLSGIDMSDVKVHYNSSQPAQLNAHAYAQGNHIHIAPGQEKHLPHEAWHVVQQMQGRVKPTKQLKGKVSINDNVGLEKEADVMGQKALTQKKATGGFSINSPQNKLGLSEINSQIQLKNDEEVLQMIGGKAIQELKDIVLKIPSFMHEAFWRWVGVVGASVALAYLTGGGNVLSIATRLFGPTLGWLGFSALRLAHHRFLDKSEGERIHTGPYIEDTFHLQTYSLPWSAGDYSVVRTGIKEKLPRGRFIFVVDAPGVLKFRSSSDRDNSNDHLYVRHSQLAGGKKVFTAGRLIVTKNAIILTNESGHYAPSLATVRQYALPIIKSLGYHKDKNIQVKSFK